MRNDALSMLVELNDLSIKVKDLDAQSKFYLQDFINHSVDGNIQGMINNFNEFSEKMEKIYLRIEVVVNWFLNNPEMIDEIFEGNTPEEKQSFIDFLHNIITQQNFFKAQTKLTREIIVKITLATGGNF